MNNATFADLQEYFKSHDGSEFYVENLHRNVSANFYVRHEKIVDAFIHGICSVRMIFNTFSGLEDDSEVRIYELTDFNCEDSYVYRLSLPTSNPIDSEFHWELAFNCGNELKIALIELMSKPVDDISEHRQPMTVDVTMVVSNIMHLSGSLDLINDVYHRQNGNQLSIDIDAERRIKSICDGIDLELHKLYDWVHQAEIDGVADVRSLQDAATATADKLTIYRHESNAAIFIYNQYLDIFG